ncbi:tol-pal system protein YbgF [Geobacter sp.]|uniref:tol-pal system protein YbgF n=1 Tax=Geobacter sp. TaxID=46610 RepID=UPI002616926A|nr:tol-pal system protein YbgF [Geobacter sp.]
MNKIARTITAAALIALAGCATRSDLDVVQRDNEELKDRLFRMEKELGGVRTETRESIETTLKGFQSEQERERKILADLQAAMEGMKVDNQVLAGKVDDLGQAARKPADDVKLLREDLERRLAAVEERLGTLEKGIEGLQKKVADAETKIQNAAVASPEGLYQKGLDTFRAGNFAAAREIFTKFLEQYPKSELAPNARYWNGETYYSEKKYEQAILEFQEVIKNFPGKEKVPAAMFKQASAFQALGDTKSARYVLKKLVEEYPASEEAKRGKEKLRELK